MTDQAATLRGLNKDMQRITVQSKLNKNNNTSARVISFTSGKGGVGKTHTVVNLAIALSELGRRVLVFDADLSLANTDILLGVPVQHTIENVLRGEKTLQDIIIDTKYGVSLIPATSGTHSFAQLNSHELMNIKESIEEIAHNYDYLFIDTPAGIGSDVMYFNAASNEVQCIINSEPTSLTDAYALLKVLSNQYSEKEVSIIVNNVETEKEANKAFKRLSEVTDRYLDIHITYSGWIPKDKVVIDCIHEQKPIMSEYPSSVAARALVQLAKTIDEDFYKNRVKGGMQFFFDKIIGAEAHGG